MSQRGVPRRIAQWIDAERSGLQNRRNGSARWLGAQAQAGARCVRWTRGKRCLSARKAGVPTSRPDMELALSAEEIPFVIKHVLIMKRAKRNFPLTSVVQFRTKFVEEFARENARARSERTERTIRGQERHLVCLRAN